MLKAIANSCNAGFLATDSRGRITFINSTGERLLHSKKSEIIDRYVTEILPISGPLVFRSIETGKPQISQHIISDGSYLLVNIDPLEESGEKTGVVCSLLGVPQLDQTVQELGPFDLINRQLQAIFESSSDGIWVCDSTGIIININQSALDNNGIKAEDVISKHVSCLQNLGLGENHVTPKVLSTKKRASAMPYVKATNRHLLCTGTPVFDENGQLILVVVNERDLTELNEIRKELQQSRMLTEKVKDELTELKMLELSDDKIIAESKSMRDALKMVIKLAHLDTSNVLILGETGTGKGLLAKFIYQSDKRKNKPFMQINCAALPENLIEAELFGYEKGAFTGAGDQGKAGLIELAEGGTLFLDEIGDLPYNLQAKLLKYLDDCNVQRLGSTQPRKIECNVISATNQDLVGLVAEGKFRRDLFYRLNSFTVHIAPLRKRKDDILPLVQYYLKKYNDRFGVNRVIGAAGFNKLRSYPFPGNVRELSNIIKHAVAMSEEAVLDNTIIAGLESDRYDSADRTYKAYGAYGGRNLNDEIMAVEKKIIKDAIQEAKTVREVASILGISHPTAFRKMKKHGLSF